MYRSHFEDDWGTVDYKDLPRPELADFLYKFLPRIDEHNKRRQAHLRLEKKWPTENCWFRLQVTLVGMSVIDLLLLLVHLRPDEYSHVTTVKFADTLCAGLKQWRAPNPTDTVAARRVQDGHVGNPLLGPQADAKGLVDFRKRTAGPTSRSLPGRPRLKAGASCAAATMRPRR